MKKFKKIILALSLTLIIFTLSACSGNKEVRKVTNSSEAVAELTMHTFDGSYGAMPMLPNFGHSFISVKNISGTEFLIGKYLLAPNENVTIGTWGQSDHIGIWYNLESVYYELGKYDTNLTLSKNINKAQLDSINKHMESKDSWSFFYNCTAFTIGVWNEIADGDKIDYFGIPTPNMLKSRMKEFDNSKNMKRLENFNDIGYFENDTMKLYQLKESK